MTPVELLAEIERLGAEPLQAHEIARWMEARYDDLLSALRGVGAAREASNGATKKAVELFDRNARLEKTLAYLRTQAKNGTLHPQVVIQNVDAALSEVTP